MWESWENYAENGESQEMHLARTWPRKNQLRRLIWSTQLTARIVCKGLEKVLTYLQVDSFLVWRVLELDSKEKGDRKVSLLLGTWVKSSSVVRSRPFVVSTMGSVPAQHHNASLYACYRKLYLHTFVVSTMGSVTAQHYNVSFYACYSKLYLNETHRDTVMFMLVLSWHRPCCSVDLHIVYLCRHMCIHAYTQTVA